MRLYYPDTVDPDASSSLLQRWRQAVKRRRALRAAYGVSRLEDAVAIIRNRDGPEHALVGGHFDLPGAREALGEGLRAVALLRDPLTRVRSEYAYERLKYPERDALRGFRSRTLPRAARRYSFEGYVDWLYDRRETYANLASRFLGWSGEGPAWRFLGSNLLHVGVLEASDVFAQGLSWKLNRQIRLPLANVTPGEPVGVGSLRTRARIEALYENDFRLHAAAAEVRGHP